MIYRAVLGGLTLTTFLVAGAAQAVPTRTATPTATPEPLGCCQNDPVSRNQPPICGNAVKQSDCVRAFGNRARFCADCGCSSHTTPGFTFQGGECVDLAPPRPTATATATVTSTPTPDSGCCQVNTSRPGPRPYVCGNDITRDSCLNDFGAGATFCADCVCSTHTSPGFGSASGTCLGRSSTSRPRPVRPTRAPRPTRPPRPARPPR